MHIGKGGGGFGKRKRDDTIEASYRNICQYVYTYKTIFLYRTLCVCYQDPSIEKALITQRDRGRRRFETTSVYGGGARVSESESVSVQERDRERERQL